MNIMYKKKFSLSALILVALCMMPTKSVADFAPLAFIQSKINVVPFACVLGIPSIVSLLVASVVHKYSLKCEDMRNDVMYASDKLELALNNEEHSLGQHIQNQAKNNLQVGLECMFSTLAGIVGGLYLNTFYRDVRVAHAGFSGQTLVGLGIILSALGYNYATSTRAVEKDDCYKVGIDEGVLNPSANNGNLKKVKEFVCKKVICHVRNVQDGYYLKQFFVIVGSAIGALMAGENHNLVANPHRK